MMLLLTKSHFKHGGRGRAIALLCSAPVFFMNEWTRRAQRKADRRRTKPQRIKNAKAHYARQKADGTFSTRWAVLNCYFRERFSLGECSEVLDIAEDRIMFEIDTIRQDAR